MDISLERDKLLAIKYIAENTECKNNCKNCAFNIEYFYGIDVYHVSICMKRLLDSVKYPHVDYDNLLSAFVDVSKKLLNSGKSN
jgi:hypothetical protein